MFMPAFGEQPLHARLLNGIHQSQTCSKPLLDFVPLFSLRNDPSCRRKDEATSLESDGERLGVHAKNRRPSLSVY